MTLSKFRHEMFSVTLPVVPSTMVPTPPDSHFQGIIAASQLPHGASYPFYQASLAPTLGTARVYTMPHALAVYWAYGGLLRDCTITAYCNLNDVPRLWQPFFHRMERRHRPYAPVTGPLAYPSSMLPTTVPTRNTWTVVVYSQRRHLPYLRNIVLMIHTDTVWILFNGVPKDLIPPHARVPGSLIRAPHAAAVISARAVPHALRTHFGNIFTQDPVMPFGIPNMSGSISSIQADITPTSEVRVYHRRSHSLTPWMTAQSQRLATLGYTVTREGTWHHIRWELYAYPMYPQPQPAAMLWIFVAPHGWAAVACRP